MGRENYSGSSPGLYPGKAYMSARSLALVFASVLLFSSGYHFFHAPGGLLSLSTTLNTFDQHMTGYCDHVPAISNEEFGHRQNNLAKTLRELGATAYIAEPGANTQFFGNFSQANWRLSERPLLMIILAEPSGITSAAQTIILTPKFEATRSKSLPLPSLSNGGLVHYVEWAEESDPYSVALSAIPRASSDTIVVDQSVRKFIADGFQRADPSVKVISAPLEITQLRERKSEKEINILKCVNEATLLSIRSVHKRLYNGIRESQARQMIANTLRSAGLQDGGCLTLFGENAALPHGSGTDRTLSSKDFALFDCTASLHGYYSDVTRTVALLETKSDNSQGPSQEHRDIWAHVQSAQRKAFGAARNGTITSEVDKAARQELEQRGFAQYFTHRLGHGIGLEVHEQPYLRGGSKDMISTGHTFSNEPGIYIEGKIGVRLEDCFYIDNNGAAKYLTEGVGGPSSSPWSP